MTSQGVGGGRDPQAISSGSTPLYYLGSRLPAEFKPDHRRAIDYYIDYFGDGAPTGTEPLARRVTPVDEQAIPDGGAEGARSSFSALTTRSPREERR
jgi:hypothetical protein